MTGKTLAAMTAEIREINVAKGWRPADGGPGENTWGDYIALLHSEVSEALEAYRDHRLADATKSGSCAFPEGCDNHPAKPEGVGSEMADVLIRLLDMCDVFGIGVSGYERMGDIRSAETFVPVRSFGDNMAWLHSEITTAWERRERVAVVLRALLTVTRRFGIDLDAEYEQKVAYNRGREFQHGGRTLAGDRYGVSPGYVCAKFVPFDPGAPEHGTCGGCGARYAEHAKESPLTPSTTARYNALYMAIPTDPRDWWISDETDEFLSQWERLGLPRLVLHDASSERLTLWCSDVRKAAEMIGMADHVTNDESFGITRGSYEVCVVQAETKETKDA
jgi:NTP pyrophosphatase (non-canonical NTP hydrolase)